MLPDPKFTDGSGGGGIGGPGSGGGGSSSGGGINPTMIAGMMAQYSFHAMLVSLNIQDTPVYYTPSKGPVIRFTATYNQREAYQPAIFPYSNLGSKWTFNWMAYIKDDPNSTNANKEYFVAGGGTQLYKYDSTNLCFQTSSQDRTRLYMVTTNSYERRFPDGSKEVFDLTDGATSNPRKIFLTKIIDASSNTVSIAYDGSFRVSSVTDAAGLVSTLSYDLPGDTLKITKVTDPFGRYATLTYTNGELVKITDVIGVTSEFTYSGSFITSLTTPYGTTSFAYGEVDRTRWLEATDPLGQTERCEFRAAATAPLTATDSPAPSGYYNNGLNLDNTFYWDKKAYAYTNDVTKARITHWLQTPTGRQASRIAHSEKQPLERRVWYEYPNPGGLGKEGDHGKPISVARVLDDGSTQKWQYEYNALGKVTKVTDPTNRVTLHVYSTNLVDLLEVRQKVGSTNELLASYIYDSSHRPMFAIDAAGQTNSFAYNSSGQVTWITNALGETVAMYYNSNGYVTNITGAVSGATTTFTYDGTNRVRTITDSEGYSLTLDYDPFDRPVKVTFPDGTYTQTIYKWLDPVLVKDRRGHWTQRVYDPLRRLTDVQDALGRVTHFEWCGCGALESISDALGRLTSWERDLQGRVTAKVYPDQTRMTYAYESATSRLKSLTDAKNQTTWYDYYIDDNPKKITYSNAVVATPSVTFAYHTNYNRIVSMIDGIGTNTYSYHAVSNTVVGAGRLESIDGPLTNDTITYVYDELGRVKSRAIDSVAERVTYDSLGRITVLTNVLGSFTTSYVNNTLRLASNNYPNGQVATFSYFGNSGDQRLQTIWHKKSDGSTISKFDYTYDPDGQIATWTQQADSGTPKVWVAEYDVMDQLLAVTVRSNGIAGAILNRYVYAYDKAGNRTGEQIDLGVSGATHNDLNQVTSIGTSTGSVRFRGSVDELGTVSIGGVSANVDTRTSNFVGFVSITSGSNLVSAVAVDFSSNKRTNNYGVIITNNGVPAMLRYDMNGNVTNSYTSTRTNYYEWDGADRLAAIEIKEVGQVIKRSEFTYDGLGNRAQIVQKTNGVQQSDHRYLWCNGRLCEKRPSNGDVERRYFLFGEQILGTNYLYARDHLGSVRATTDAAEIVQGRLEYDPYGGRRVITGNVEPDFGFTGHFYHSPSAVHLALYRALDTANARWLSRDPIEEAGGPNVYAYVLGNPISRIDPYGLWAAGVQYGGTVIFNPTGAGPGVATGAVGLGYFSGSSFGGYATGGAAVGPLGIKSFPPGGIMSPNFGAYAGYGGALWFSNVNTPDELECLNKAAGVNFSPTFGPFDLAVGVSVSWNPATGKYHVAVDLPFMAGPWLGNGMGAGGYYLSGGTYTEGVDFF